MARKIAARLREERLRVEPHQGLFARRVGVTQQKQSFLENANRELRAEYLAEAAAAGVDVCYVLTGERSDLGRLSPEASALVTSFERLPDGMKRAAIATIDAMAGEPPTLHAPRQAYRSGVVTRPAGLPSEAALEQMFEGLLAANPRLQGAELAHELARHLPTAIEIARGPLLAADPDDPAATEEGSAAPGSDRREPRRARRT